MTVGLVINVNKTKYVKIETNQIIIKYNRLKQEIIIFDNVMVFTSLGIEINCKGTLLEEINNRIMVVNKAIFGKL